MPRPRRGRPAPARAAKAAPPTSPSPDPASDSDDAREQQQQESRGRSRTTRSAGRLSLGERDAVKAANRIRDAVLDRLANEDATTTTSGNTAGEEASASPVEVGRRAIATPAHRRDTTGLDLADDDMMFGDLDDSFADGEVPQGFQSADVSSMSFSSFRPRSRHGSFIGRNDPPIRPSSRGGNTSGISSFNIGLFRRRAREPSILGTNQKPLREPSRAVQDSELESEGEFEPEAESTPLTNRRRTRQSTDIQRESSPEIPELSNPKKRKSEDAHHRGVRPEKVSRQEPDEQSDGDSSSELSEVPPSPHQPDDESDVPLSPRQPPAAEKEEDDESDSELSELSSPREAPPSLFQRPVTPINQDEITAPPASSGSETESPGAWPDIRALAKKRRRPSVTTPTRPDQLSDISSPPSLTHSPNFEHAKGPRTRGRPAPHQQASPELTTADLLKLLPKRRSQRTRDPLGLDSDEELDTTGLGNEEDELSYVDTQAARRRKAGQLLRHAAASARPASRGGRAAAAANAPSELQQVKDVISAAELEQARKMFREVDKWELEYESVTEASSPSAAREEEVPAATAA